MLKTLNKSDIKSIFKTHYQIRYSSEIKEENLDFLISNLD